MKLRRFIPRSTRRVFRISADYSAAVPRAFVAIFWTASSTQIRWLLDQEVICRLILALRSTTEVAAVCSPVCIFDLSNRFRIQLSLLATGPCSVETLGFAARQNRSCNRFLFDGAADFNRMFQASTSLRKSLP